MVSRSLASRESMLKGLVRKARKKGRAARADSSSGSRPPAPMTRTSGLMWRNRLISSKAPKLGIRISIKTALMSRCRRS